ncbi:MAG: hypothetical protein R3B96_17975 [Pirellulaceae bacterium]
MSFDSCGNTERDSCGLASISPGGTRGGSHAEDDVPDPVTTHGQTMHEAERLIAAELSDALILRISSPMGPSFNGHAGAID